MVRCPYLYESEELKIFIRPQMDVERALTFLPKLSNQKVLERITPYYSIMGNVNDKKMTDMNL